MTREQLADNPFLVLEIAVSASRAEVERAGQKLLAQLTIGVSSVTTYRTPFGLRERDESKVRSALSALRDPEQRAFYELWHSSDAQADQSVLQGWPQALASIGWRGPCTD
jgi:hypothetical protein